MVYIQKNNPFKKIALSDEEKEEKSKKKAITKETRPKLKVKKVEKIEKEKQDKLHTADVKKPIKEDEITEDDKKDKIEDKKQVEKTEDKKDLTKKSKAWQKQARAKELSLSKTKYTHVSPIYNPGEGDVGSVYGSHIKDQK